MSAGRGLEGRDEGMTAAELVIAAFVTAIVLVMASSFFFRGTTAIMQSRNTSLDAGTVSSAMMEVSKVIRSGAPNPVLNNSIPDPVVLAGTAESVTLYSYADASVTNTAPMIMQFSVDPTTRQLVEKRWAATTNAGGYFTFPNYTTAVPTWSRTIAGPIGTTPSGKSPLFVFNAASGGMTLGASGLSAPQRNSIVSVLVTIRVNGSGYAGANGVEEQNTVGLPNLGLGT
ncbi:hypothetical protein ACFVU2_15625 [Leifsonia sp. NPDC058194]|uniref:hypothetical protein n=1 Tax=Leifsonia sp. NPDC058194 TaxID=3346374 RepID=UPI0036DA15EF